MSIFDRRKREKETLRASILDTSWQIVKTDGWQSLSIRKIADAIDYSVPVIYDHFDNKEAILLEFGRQGFEKIIKTLKKARNSSDDPKEQLKAIANAYWNFAFKNKEHYQLMWGLNIPGCEMSKCIPEKSGIKEMVMEPILKIIEKSKNNEASACVKYHTFWSILHGLISIKMIAPPTDTEELNKQVLNDAVTGFIKNLST